MSCSIRYRVLIETADSIMNMHAIAGDTRTKLQELHDSLPQLSNIGGGQSAPSASSSSSSAPTQLQLLLLLRTYALAPTSIWTSLDAHDFEAALALLLRMRGVQAQIQAVEHWPADSASAATHPELKRLIDAAMTSMQAGSSSAATATTPASSSSSCSTAATASSSSASLVSSLAEFFQHHASYHAELPNLIAHTAFARMSGQRALTSKSYADCIVALAVLMRGTTHEPQRQPQPNLLGLQLLDAFLDSKRKQMHDLVWSAERALTSFRSSSSAPNPTPILVHVCQHLLLTLQYTLLDTAMIFASIHPSANPFAKLVTTSSTGTLQQTWKTCNVGERVKAFWTRIDAASASATTTDPNARAAQANAAAASVTIESTVLAERVSAWLRSMQSFLSDALLHRLLPFLLPPATTASNSSGSSKRGGGRKGASSTATAGCVSLQHLRDEILRTANFEHELSASREGARAEDAAEERRERERELDRTRTDQEALERQSAEQKDVVAADSASATASKHRAQEKQKSSDLASSSPEGQARARRKRMMERWDEACTLLFGQQASTVLAGGSALTTSSLTPSSPQSFCAPFSLFDFAFFAPLASFTHTLIDRAFERLTLLEKMEKFMRNKKAQQEHSHLHHHKAKEDANKQGGASTKPKSKQPQMQEEKIEDEFDLSSLRKKKLAPASSGSHDGSSYTTPIVPVTDLNGERESEVQEIVSIFRRQLQKLAKECRAILECKYVQSQSHSMTLPGSKSLPTTTANLQRDFAPLLFPALARYLQEELTPQLTKKYNQLVEKLVEQLKKKLTESVARMR